MRGSHPRILVFAFFPAFKNTPVIWMEQS